MVIIQTIYSSRLMNDSVINVPALSLITSLK